MNLAERPQRLADGFSGRGAADDAPAAAKRLLWPAAGRVAYRLCDQVLAQLDVGTAYLAVSSAAVGAAGLILLAVIG